jgi:hypothetical protein
MPIRTLVGLVTPVVVGGSVVIACLVGHWGVVSITAPIVVVVASHSGLSLRGRTDVPMLIGLPLQGGDFDVATLEFGLEEVLVGGVELLRLIGLELVEVLIHQVEHHLQLSLSLGVLADGREIHPREVGVVVPVEYLRVLLSNILRVLADPELHLLRIGRQRRVSLQHTQYLLLEARHLLKELIVGLTVEDHLRLGVVSDGTRQVGLVVAVVPKGNSVALGW